MTQIVSVPVACIISLYIKQVSVAGLLCVGAQFVSRPGNVPSRYEILRSCRQIPCHVEATTPSFQPALILLLIAVRMTLCEEMLIASLTFSRLMTYIYVVPHR